MVGLAALFAIALAAIMILAAAVIDLRRSLRDDTIPDPDVVRQLRPRGNVDLLPEDDAEAQP